MENIIKQCLQDRTLGMFSKEWYTETSKYIFDKVNNRENETEGYVYFIRSYSTNEIKIGKTINLQKRLYDIKVYVGDIHVLGIICSIKYGEIEKRMHSEFKDYRVRGEWFYINDIKIIEEAIIKNSGVLINKKFNNSVNVLSASFIRQNYLAKYDIPDNVYQYLEDSRVFMAGEYSKSVLYENIPFEHEYSQRKFTSYILRYIKEKGMRYEERKSGDNRFVRVFF